MIESKITWSFEWCTLFQSFIYDLVGIAESVLASLTSEIVNFSIILILFLKYIRSYLFVFFAFSGQKQSSCTSPDYSWTALTWSKRKAVRTGTTGKKSSYTISVLMTSADLCVLFDFSIIIISSLVVWCVCIQSTYVQDREGGGRAKKYQERNP